MFKILVMIAAALVILSAGSLVSNRQSQLGRPAAASAAAGDCCAMPCSVRSLLITQDHINDLRPKR
jgi:hypothetical protein